MARLESRGEDESGMKKRDIIFIMLGILLLLIVVIFPIEWVRARPLICVQNMAVLGNFSTVWAAQNNNGNMPSDFLQISNWAPSFDRFICPSDRSRRPAQDWASFSFSNTSYVIVGPGIFPTNNTPWLTCLIHTNFFVYGDGGMRGFDPNKY